MKRSLLAAALVASSAVAANAATLVNGSFEDLPGALNNGNWGLFDSIDGWSSTGGKIEIHTDPTLSIIDAFDGDNYVELHSDGLATISQDVFLTAGRYMLSFMYSARSNQVGDNDLSYSVSGGALDGDVLFAPNNDLPRGEWTEITGEFIIAQNGTYSLNFSALAGGPNSNDKVGALLDDIQIAAVPVPAAGLLLLTALGGFAATGRRRKG